MAKLYIGIMSGTSVDAVDAVLCKLSEQGQAQYIADYSLAIPTVLQHQLQEAMTATPRSVVTEHQLAADYSDLCIDAVEGLLRQQQLDATAITTLGCHGQTLWHQPPSQTADGAAFSHQLINAPQIAIATGIDVVFDFRQKDILLGGEGAPLVPAFHYHSFQQQLPPNTVVLNLGGIANITWITEAAEHVLGFDTGPANTLMDQWFSHYYGAPGYDKDGRKAASGRVIDGLLTALKGHPYFSQPPPKSTGREHFNLSMLLPLIPDNSEPEDVLRTLQQLTVETIVEALAGLPNKVEHVVACGGGVNNRALMNNLKQRLGDCSLRTTADYGIHPQAVEAMAFAWLAWCYDHKKPGNLPAVTGASRPAVLGSKVSAD